MAAALSGVPEGWVESAPRQLQDNPFSLIADDWMLVTAGDPSSWNTMTASWGGLGVLWNKNVAFSFIRPTRYTWSFMERFPRYTLSFFPPEHRKALEFCGSRSGRDGDKVAAAGLSPIDLNHGAVSFAEARLVLQCRKLYAQDLAPESFVDAALDANYPKKDYHRLYVGEIEKLWIAGA